MALPLVNALGNLIPEEVLCMFVGEGEVIHSTVADCVNQEDAMTDVDVPGDARQCRVVSNRVVNSTTALVYWWIRLHINNFSLNGILGDNLPVDAFCVDLNGTLKGSWEMTNRLVPLNDQLRSSDMSILADFADQNIYQPHLFGDPPAAVQDLLILLNNFTPDQYLLLKSHPALEDAIGECALFSELYGLLMALKGRDFQKFSNVMANMENDINSPTWVFDGIQNVFIHQVLRFNTRATGLLDNVVTFLSQGLQCGNGNGERCLRTRRNAQSHLTQDYCAGPAGTYEAFRAAVTAAVLRKPALTGNFQGLQHIVTAPFWYEEARAIGKAITDALQKYRHSALEADAAATAAAVYLCTQQIIYAHPSLSQTVLSGPHYRRALLRYNQQQTNAGTAAANAAQAVHQQAPQPLMPRNMFNIRDVSNMLSLMEPRLVCILHQAMFDAGELQSLEWHWECKDVNLLH